MLTKVKCIPVLSAQTHNKQVSISPTCQWDANYFLHDFYPYYKTESKYPTEKPLVNIGTKLKVLDHVPVRIKISDNEENKKKWTFMVSDGVPYIYSSILQDTYVTCSICNEEINNHQLPKDEFEI